jgi:hypothetical protein
MPLIFNTTKKKRIEVNPDFSVKEAGHPDASTHNSNQQKGAV